DELAKHYAPVLTSDRRNVSVGLATGIRVMARNAHFVEKAHAVLQVRLGTQRCRQLLLRHGRSPCRRRKVQQRRPYKDLRANHFSRHADTSLRRRLHSAVSMMRRLLLW